jgi:hypothetical protein
VDKPSADAFLDVFNDRFYAPSSPSIVGAMEFGWTGHDDRPDSLALLVSVGPKRERVVIRNGVSPEREMAIVHQLLFRDPTRPYRFPIVIERDKTRITLDGRERVFTSYSYRGQTVATAAVRGLTVTVECTTRLVQTLRLGPLEPDRFRQLFKASEQHRDR